MSVKIGTRVYHIYSNYNFLHLLNHHPSRFRVARNFKAVICNGSPGFIRSAIPQHLVVNKCLLSNNTAVCRWCSVHLKSFYVQCSQLFKNLKKYPLLRWTCTFATPLQAYLLFSYSVPFLKEGIILSADCTATHPVQFTTVPIEDIPQSSRSSQIAAFVYALRECILTNLRAIHLMLVFFPLLLIYPLTSKLYFLYVKTKRHSAIE